MILGVTCIAKNIASRNEKIQFTKDELILTQIPRAIFTLQQLSTMDLHLSTALVGDIQRVNLRLATPFSTYDSWRCGMTFACTVHRWYQWIP